MKKYILLAREIVKSQEKPAMCITTIKRLFKTEAISKVCDLWKLVCALVQTENVRPELLEHLVNSKDFDFLNSAPLYNSFGIGELRHIWEDAPDLAGKLLCKILESPDETSLIEEMKYSIKQRLSTPLLLLANANPIYFEDSSSDILHYLSDRDYLLIFETLYEYCKRNNIGFKTELLKLKDENDFLFPDSGLIYTLIHCPQIMEYKGLNKLVDRIIPRERFPWSLSSEDADSDYEDNEVKANEFKNNALDKENLSEKPIYDLTTAVKDFPGSKHRALAVLLQNLLAAGNKCYFWLTYFGIELTYYYYVTGQLEEIAEHFSSDTVELLIEGAYPYAEYRGEEEGLLKGPLKAILNAAPYRFACTIKSLPWDTMSSAAIYAEFTDSVESAPDDELVKVAESMLWEDWQYQLLQKWSNEASRLNSLFTLFKVKDWRELIEGGIFFMERKSIGAKKNLLWDLFNLRDEEGYVIPDGLILNLWEEGIPNCPGCITYAFPESRLPALFEQLLKKYDLGAPLPNREHWAKKPMSMQDVLQASLFATRVHPHEYSTCDFAFPLTYLENQTFLHWLTSDHKPLFPPKLIEAIQSAQPG